jgi:hypothetical protein
MAALMPLNDRCYIGTSGAPAYGEPRSGYTYDTDTAVRCAVMNEIAGEDAHGLQIPRGMVRVAFRTDSGIVAGSRIQVYRRLRQTLAASEYYSVEGEPRRVRGRLIAPCKRTNAQDVA